MAAFPLGVALAAVEMQLPRAEPIAGGVAALVVKKLRAWNGAKNINHKTQSEGERNESQTNEVQNGGDRNEPSDKNKKHEK